MISVSHSIDILLNNPSSPPSIKAKDNCDHLIAYTALNVKTLLKCSKERVYYQQKLLPNIKTFIKHIYNHCKLTPTILVVALLYLDRLKHGLPQESRGEYDTPYKMFIAAVILATKFIEDSKKIVHSIYKVISPLYNAKTIGDMERSFLGVIKYELFVNLSEVYQFVLDHEDTLKLELGIN